jgi:methyl-accepting chemotaxis protein
MNLKNMKISSQLILGFGAIFVLMMILTAIGISRVQEVEGILGTINEVNSVKQRYAINFRGSVHDRAIAVRDVVLASDNAAAQPDIELIKTLADNYAKSAGPLDDIFSDTANITADEKSALANIKAIETKTQPMITQLLELRLADKTPEAIQVLKQQAAPAFVEWLAAINVLIDLEEKMNQELTKQARSLTSNFLMLMVSLCAISIAIGAVAAWLIGRGLLNKLGGEPAEAQEIANAIASGNLSEKIRVNAGDNSSLIYSIGNMQTNLRNLISQIQISAETIGSGAQQISAGNTELSSRTEQQASSLEETASSMEEMASTVKQNAENAKQANLMAREASGVAVKGGEVVSEVVNTMAEINTSSKKIVDIISVIDGIAFQTNILALNAAVEAARAGEQGRGFAVVAAEVRSLAQRSAAAAKEIKQLIGDSVEKVAGGTQLVGEAGKTMQEIVASVKQVTDIVNEIAAASQEQSAGIDQVNNAITQMDEVTQQNAALVEEAAAAASSLEAKAQELTDATNMFNLGDNQRTLGHQTSHQQSSNGNLNEIKTTRHTELPSAKANAGKRLKAPKAKADESKDWEEF